MLQLPFLLLDKDVNIWFVLAIELVNEWSLLEAPVLEGTLIELTSLKLCASVEKETN